MRVVLLALVILFLAACNEPSVTSDFPNVSCDDVASSIEKQPKGTESDRLKRVEKLACYYGMEQLAEEQTCSIPTYPPEFGGKNTEESYELKDDAIYSYYLQYSLTVTRWKNRLYHGEYHTEAKYTTQIDAWKQFTTYQNISITLPAQRGR
ncbi:MAG: hypothetical protein ACRD36_03735 [Candidatus Acidiferrum sp.]